MKASRIAAAGGVVAGVAVLAVSSPASRMSACSPRVRPRRAVTRSSASRSPTSGTTPRPPELEVTFPSDHPLSSVQPQPVEGWDIKITKSRLATPLEVHGKKIDEAVSKVTWTATGDGIEPGFFQKFPVSVGTLPEDTDQLVFKALQTYSNKEVVRWIEVPQEGQEEPENPAPVLALTAPAEDGHGHGAADDDKASDDAEKASAETAAASDDDSGGTDTTARVLGVVGIAVGAAGVAYGVLAGRRRTA